MSDYISVSDGWQTIRLDSKSWVPVDGQSRVCEVIWWPDSTSEDTMSSWIADSVHFGLRAVWSNLHDLDFGAKPHFHSMLYAKSPKTFAQWAKWLVKHACPAIQPVNPNGSNTICLWNRVEAAARYLRHLDDSSKYQYPDIRGDFSTDTEYVQRWFNTPVLNASSRQHTADDFESFALTSLAEFIAVHHIGFWHQLFVACDGDSAVIQCARQNSCITRDLLREQREFPGVISSFYESKGGETS